MAHRIHVIAGLTIGLTISFGGNLAYAATDQYYGRWAVSDEEPAYSAKGALYKTIDFGPCGDDFCGVSVADDDSCGEVLFRFLTSHAEDELLVGHGKWGKEKKKVEVVYSTLEDESPYLFLALGSNDMDLTGREGSIPTFQANYERHGEAACTAD